MPKERLPQISPSEWAVASLIWAQDGLTAKEIAERLPAEEYGWKLKTINTFLTRLVSKGVLRIWQEEGRAFRYEAIIPREAMMKVESQSFLQRLFGGAPGPMLMYFCEESELTQCEIQELRELLDGKKAKRGKPKK